MKWLKWTLSAASLTAMIACRGSVLDDPDEMQIVRDYVETTRSISLKDKETNLRISGRIYAAHRYLQDKVAGNKITGGGSGYRLSAFPGATDGTETIFPPTPSSVFPLKARLDFDFNKDKTYAVMCLQFDNRGGLNKLNYDKGNATNLRPSYKDAYAPGSGGISLSRAVIGYRLRDNDEEKLDLEIGRRKSSDVFKSPLQDGGPFDGALVRYKYKGTDYGDYTLDVGSFIIDNRVSHYGQAIQAGLRNPENGLFGSVAFINHYRDGAYADGTWGDVSKSGDPAARENFQSRFMNTHASIGIALPDETSGKVATFAIGGAMNHKAKPIAKTNNRRDNKAYFIAMTYGSSDNLIKPGDWAVKASLQKVGAQAIPEANSFNAISKPGQTTGIPFFADENDGTFGFGNYKGINLEADYTISPGLLLNIGGVYSKPNRKYGMLSKGKSRFTALQTQLCYAF